MCEVIVTEPFGTVADAKGNKTRGLHSDKKPGLQVCDKQKISPWDLLEGHKNPAPLSWSWFGAVKSERKSMKYEDFFHELKYANFSHLEKPKEYFLEAPPLPQEELEPAHKDDKEEDKTMFTSMSSDPNMIMLGRGGMMPTGNQANAPLMNQNMGQMGNRFQPRMGGPQNLMAGGQMMNNSNAMQIGGSQQMTYGGQQQQQIIPQRPQMNQQQQWGGYTGGGSGGGMGSQQSMGYPAPPYGAPQQQSMQMGGSIGPRFGAPSQSMSAGVVGNQAMNASQASQPGTKQALQNLLRTRGPNSYMSNNPVGATPVGASNVGMQNPVGGSQVSQFALPRQNYGGMRTQMPSAPPYNGRSQMGPGGGMNVQDTMSNPGQFGSMGSGPGQQQQQQQPQQQQQFGNNFGGPSAMNAGGSYMMRQPQPGGYNPQSMMNRHQQPGMQQNMMTGGGGGGYNMGGMNRMTGPGYMQSAATVNMNSMQQQQQQQQQPYRPVMNIQQQQQQLQQQQQQQLQQQQMMQRMQTPQLMAQLQRGPANMNQQMNYQQRF